MTRKSKLITLAAVLLVGGIVAGAAQQSDLYFLIKKNFTIFSEVYREVSLNYVDEVNPEKLMRKGIEEMLENLDPYTVFIDEADNQNLEIMTRGNYGGIGLDVGFRGDKVVVIAPMEGYPAHRKGIRAGDVIVKVNDIPVSSLTPDEVQDLTMGEPGSKVTLTIERYGVDQQLTFELQRERIEIKNIAYAGLVGPDNTVGYILLTRFSQNTAEEIRLAIEEFRSQTDLAGLILDLRNNPGGLLDEAVKTIDKFVGPGLTVVETRGRLSDHNNVFKTEEPALLKDLPLVVLQNGGSASASEVVSGALQDLDRAVIVGEQSFGKGLVQIVRPLSYNTALKITTSRYYIPSGRSIQAVTYTHDENNSGLNKPDSLKKKFKTRNGRTVYDGQGISPDVNIREDRPTLLETALHQNSHFFFFANRYVADHDQLNLEEVSDEMFAEFRNYLDKESFEYVSKTERYLDQLEQQFADMNAEGTVRESIAELEQAVEQEKEAAFEDQKEELKRTLYLEVISRYKGLKGRYTASVETDPMVGEAVSIISDGPAYRDMLGYGK